MISGCSCIEWGGNQWEFMIFGRGVVGGCWRTNYCFEKAKRPTLLWQNDGSKEIWKKRKKQGVILTSGQGLMPPSVRMPGFGRSDARRQNHRASRLPPGVRKPGTQGCRWIKRWSSESHNFWFVCRKLEFYIPLESSWSVESNGILILMNRDWKRKWVLDQWTKPLSLSKKGF